MRLKTFFKKSKPTLTTKLIGETMSSKLREKHVTDFLVWCRAVKNLKMQYVNQPWMVGEVFTGKVWEAVYYSPEDKGHKYPRYGRGLKKYVEEFNEHRRTTCLKESGN